MLYLDIYDASTTELYVPPVVVTAALNRVFFMWQRLLVVALTACFAVSAQSREGTQNLGWDDYRNDRFGLSLKYPTNVFDVERTAEAGDGQLFISKDGRARLLVGTFKNSDNHSPSTYQKFIAQKSYPGFKIDYSPVGRSWSVLSGERDGTMFYEKVMFTCGASVISSFAMLYPVAHRQAYDAIVEKIEDSFRAGSEVCS